MWITFLNVFSRPKMLNVCQLGLLPTIMLKSLPSERALFSVNLYIMKIESYKLKSINV